MLELRKAYDAAQSLQELRFLQQERDHYERLRLFFAPGATVFEMI